MEKEAQTYVMHNSGLGERESFSDKTTETLSQRIIPALHMCCFTCFFAYSGVLLLGNHCLISTPKIGIAMPRAVCGRQESPIIFGRYFRFYHLLHRLLLDVSCDRERSIPRLYSLFLRRMTITRQLLVLLILDQMPQEITAFHYCCLFFSHSLTVLRDTPNVLVNPLKLLRSSYDLNISSRLSSV